MGACFFTKVYYLLLNFVRNAKPHRLQKTSDKTVVLWRIHAVNPPDIYTYGEVYYYGLQEKRLPHASQLLKPLHDGCSSYVRMQNHVTAESPDQ